jgi:hypothetical protein
MKQVLFIPASQADLSPTLVFQFHYGIGLLPAFRLFERKPLSVYARTPSTTIGWWYSVQYAITTHPDQGTTRFVSQGTEKVMVAILGIGDDEVEIFQHLRLPLTTQSFDLLYPHFNVRLGA